MTSSACERFADRFAERMQTMKYHDSTTPWKLIVRKEVTPEIILSADASDKSRTVRLTFLYFLVS